MKVLVTLLLTIVVIVGTVGGLWMSANNNEVSLRNQIAAQQKNNEAVLDTMWRIIKQQAQVTDAYKDSFYKGFKDIIGSRYEKERGGALLSMITEANPSFDTKLFQQLMTSIEGQRTNFLRNQKMLLDLKRQHDDVRQKFPSGLFVGTRPAVDVVIVTSTAADDAFKKGKDDTDDNLFPQKK